MSAAPLFVRLSLPDGLEELVEGVAREVLHSDAKEQQEIYSVARNYFEKLISRRKLGQSEDGDKTTLYERNMLMLMCIVQLMTKVLISLFYFSAYYIQNQA